MLPIVQTGPSSPAAPLQPPPPLWSPALLWASFARLPAALHGFELLCWGFALLCWQLCMALHGSALLCMALHGSAWLCIALHCSAGSSAWLCIALHTLCMLPLSFACWFCSLHAPPARCRLCSACTALSACCRLCRCSPPPNKTPNTLCAFGSRLLGSQQWGGLLLWGGFLYLGGVSSGHPELVEGGVPLLGGIPLFGKVPLFQGSLHTGGVSFICVGTQQGSTLSW